MIYLFAIIAALLTSYCYARYIRYVAGGKAGKAAGFDFGLMVMSSLMTQAWFVAHSDLRIFLLYDVTAAIGTYYAVKSGNSHGVSGEGQSKGVHHHIPCG